VFVVQNDECPRAFAKRRAEPGVVESVIDALWAKLTAAIDKIDVLIVYVGTMGGERAIELAKGLSITVIFVFCQCDVPAKVDRLEQAGLHACRRLVCGCEQVNETMGHVCRKFLSTGKVLEAA
jgi:hypothetical protein